MRATTRAARDFASSSKFYATHNLFTSPVKWWTTWEGGRKRNGSCSHIRAQSTCFFPAVYWSDFQVTIHIHCASHGVWAIITLLHFRWFRKPTQLAVDSWASNWSHRYEQQSHVPCTNVGKTEINKKKSRLKIETHCLHGSVVYCGRSVPHALRFCHAETVRVWLSADWPDNPRGGVHPISSNK